MFNIIYFFCRFPIKDKIRLKKWLHAIRREKWKPSKHSRICSAHFTPKDFSGFGMNVPYLKADAVPSVFKAFSNNLKKNKKSPTKFRKRKLPDLNIPSSSDLQVLDEHDVPPEHDDPSEHGENEPDDQVSTETRAEEASTSKRLTINSSSTEINLRKKIRMLNQKLRRRNKRIFFLKELLNELKKKGLLEHEAANFLENVQIQTEHNYSHPNSEFLNIINKGGVIFSLKELLNELKKKGLYEHEAANILENIQIQTEHNYSHPHSNFLDIINRRSHQIAFFILFLRQKDNLL